MKNQENFDFEKYLSYKKSNDNTNTTEEKTDENNKQNKSKAFKFPKFKFDFKSKNVEDGKEDLKKEVFENDKLNVENIKNNTKSNLNNENIKENIEENKVQTDEITNNSTKSKDTKNDNTDVKEEIREEDISDNPAKISENTEKEAEESVHKEKTFNNNTDSIKITASSEQKNQNNKNTSRKKKKKKKNQKVNNNSTNVVNNSDSEIKRNEATDENYSAVKETETEKKEDLNDKEQIKSDVSNQNNDKLKFGKSEEKAEKKPEEKVQDTDNKLKEAEEKSDKKNRDRFIITNKVHYKKDKFPKSAEEKKHNNIIIDAFESALDEDIEDFDGIGSQEESAVHYIPGKTKKPFFVIGILILIMTVIGLVSTFVFLYNVIWDFANNTKQKAEFANFIYPVVMTDPAMFENPLQLTSETVCNAAIWDIILHADTSKYPHEYGNITIPEQDVEHHATKLFGPGLNFEHKNIGDIMLTFYYNSEKKCYTIPESPKFFSYSPKVEEIKRISSDEYLLTVAYISPSPAWLIQDVDDESNVGKYMEYILGVTDNGYVINEVRESSHKILTEF